MTLSTKYAREISTDVLHMYIVERRSPGGLMWTWACARVREAQIAMFGVPDALVQDVTCLWCIAERSTESP